MSDDNKMDAGCCERCDGSGKAFGKACDHSIDSEPRAALPERDPSRPAEQQGMFRKFEVRRVDGSDLPGGKHYGCNNYVLDLTHDPAALPAMRAYIAAVRATHPQLAAELEAQTPESLGDLLMPREQRESVLMRGHDDLRTFLLNHITSHEAGGKSLERLELAHNDVWVLRKLLDAAPQAPALNGWTRVEDRLPDTGEDKCVSVWAVWVGAAGFPDKPRQGEARYHKSLGWQPAGHTQWDWNVTHWMPKPELPASDSKGGAA
jgi:hypothetical protein